jgi:hypothetical protein
MAVDVPLKAVEPTDLLDAFGKYAELKKQRVAAKYAEPTAQENLNKIRALIQGQNLSNQAEQLKMPFVAPREQSLLDKLKAEIAKTQTETSFIPTKYSQAGQRLGIAQGNLNLNKLIHSPEQLDALLKYRQALTQGKADTNQPIDIHGMPIKQGSLSEEAEPLDQWIPSQIGKSAKGAPERYYNPKTDETLVRFTKPEATQVGKQKVALESSLKLLPQIIDIASKGFLGSPSTGANKILDPNLRAQYESLQSRLTETLSPTFPNLPKVKQMMAKVDTLSKRFPGETANAYQARIHDLINDFHEQLGDINEQYALGGRKIKGRGVVNKTEMNPKKSFPTFNNKQEFQQWASTASPQEVQAYKEHLHG